MIDFFAADYHGPAFEWLGAAHLAALGVLTVLNLALIRFRGASSATRTALRRGLALVLWLNEFGWHYWSYRAGLWTVQTMLPLHLCSLLVWAGGLMLLTKNYRIYEFMYFMGIAGAVQVLITPDLGIHGFPHFRFFQTFLSHGLIVTSAIYMTVVERFRPTVKSIVRVVVWMNLYALLVFVINSALGSNYLMINRKPELPSLLDLLPEWPVYVLGMEVIGLLSILLLYLPFAVSDLQTRGLRKGPDPGKISANPDEHHTAR